MVNQLSEWQAYVQDIQTWYEVLLKLTSLHLIW